jgi:hypothetical protein
MPAPLTPPGPQGSHTATALAVRTFPQVVRPCLVAAGGMIASPGSSIAPPPPGYTTAGGPTAAPSCLNACGTEAGGTTMTPPRPPVALASQYNSRRPRAARESLSPPLLQQSPPVKAVPVAPSVNRHLMTMWVK